MRAGCADMIWTRSVGLAVDGCGKRRIICSLPNVNRTLAATVTVTLCASGMAFASGSWAVPRFTPTWAEIEHELNALGAKRPLPRRAPPARATHAAAPQPAAGPPAVAAVSPQTPATAPAVQSTLPGAVEGAPAPGSTPGSPPAPCPCKCSEVPPATVTPTTPAVEPPAKAPTRAPKAPTKVRRKYWWEE